MDAAGGQIRQDGDRTLVFLLAFIACSLLLHAVGFGVLTTYAGARAGTPPLKPLELVMVDVPPKPPPPPEEKKPEPPKVKQKPPPIKVASVTWPPPPPPKQAEPPPPNDTPPPQTPSKPVPLITGISMSSTTAAGGFAAPVGNTLYGKMADKAVSPSEVKAYTAPHFTPVYQVDSEPSLLGEVKPPYPDAARRDGIEGTVVLSITIDDKGVVVAAKVLNGPGYGLNEAALAAIRRAHFKPAVKNGEPVSTEIKYNYTFVLD